MTSIFLTLRNQVQMMMHDILFTTQAFRSHSLPKACVNQLEILHAFQQETVFSNTEVENKHPELHDAYLHYDVNN